MTIAFIFLFSLRCFSQCPRLDLTRSISTAEEIGAFYKTQYWQEWGSIPFSLLLLQNDREYLINATTADSSFTFTCDSIQSRESIFQKNFLATFPLINAQPTIVVGTPENTGKSQEEWTLTLVHEHFHQLQFTHPDYQSAQLALELDKGDQTGMWMLNHPFPYEDSVVNHHLTRMAVNLSLLNTDQEAGSILVKHKQLKKELSRLVGSEHYKYLNLQIWQEGFARFIELSLLKNWIEDFDSLNQNMISLDSLIKLKEKYEKKIRLDLTQNNLSNLRRGYFYSLGAAEAALIEVTNPNWKEQYFDHLFTTDYLLQEP